MECDRERLIDWVNDELSNAEREAFEAHLMSCPDCQKELDAVRHIQGLMEQVPVPEPSKDMEARFQGMLDTYRQSQEEKYDAWKNFVKSLQQLWTIQPRLQLAYSIALIIFGVAAGYIMNFRGIDKDNKKQIEALTSQVDDMRQMMMLSLVENPSASKRLQAVSYSEEINKVNSKVIDVLMMTLNEDPNVNVRLATLEALVKFADAPRVREGLVQSLTQQESPLVISAMADAMVKLQEKRSVKPLQQLLDKEELDSNVKSKIEKSIYLLI